MFFIPSASIFDINDVKVTFFLSHYNVFSRKVSNLNMIICRTTPSARPMVASFM